MVSYSSGPLLGHVEAGAVAAAFGVQASVVSGGVLCIVGVLACAGLLPGFMATTLAGLPGMNPFDYHSVGSRNVRSSAAMTRLARTRAPRRGT